MLECKLFNIDNHMLDKEKIEEAKEEIFDKEDFYLYSQEVENPNGKNEYLYTEQQIKDAIGLGIRWAIEHFLKDLWHDAEEEPNIKQGECCITCLAKFKNGSTKLCVYFCNPEGWVCDDMSPKDFKRNFNEWLYIDDLLKGGKK